MTLGGHVQLEQAVPLPVSSSVIRASVVPVCISLLPTKVLVKTKLLGTDCIFMFHYILPPDGQAPKWPSPKTRFKCHLP